MCFLCFPHLLWRSIALPSFSRHLHLRYQAFVVAVEAHKAWAEDAALREVVGTRLGKAGLHPS